MGRRHGVFTKTFAGITLGYDVVDGTNHLEYDLGYSGVSEKQCVGISWWYTDILTIMIHAITDLSWDIHPNSVKTWIGISLPMLTPGNLTVCYWKWPVSSLIYILKNGDFP